MRRVCVDLNKTRAKTPWGKAVDPSTLSVLIGMLGKCSDGPAKIVSTLSVYLLKALCLMFTSEILK